MIRVEHTTTEFGPIASIILDRRDKRNALTPDMLENVRAAADHLHAEHSRPRAVILAGEGESFCAGFDLSLCRDDPLAMGALLTKLSLSARALRRLPMPVIAAAHGAAIAGGCALICAADFIITNDNAKLGYPVVRLGVSPAVSAPLLRLQIGDARARERLLDPSLITGKEAARIGLAHESVPTPEDVIPAAQSLANTFAAKPPHGLFMTKHWLNELDGSDNDIAHAAALRTSLDLVGSHEERERLAAIWNR
jgi:enoyl-CoA hydratase/carnithine racemase